MRVLTTLLIVLLLDFGLGPAFGRAQSDFDASKHHRWARFAPGAWSQVREVAESFAEDGQLVGISTTETTTALLDKSDHSVTLRTDATVEVAGKRFDSQPQTVTQGVYGEVNGQTAKVEDAGTGQVTICDQRIPCQMRRVTIDMELGKMVTTVYFNDQTAPYELRRETVATDPSGKTLIYQTDMDVIAVNLPYDVLSELQTVAFVRTVHTSAKGKKVTVEVHCPRVPGGVVAHWSKELDSNGRLEARSVMELTDYGLTQTDADRVREGRLLFPRRPRRTEN